MSGINTGRWVAGGLVATAVIFVIEGVVSRFYYPRAVEALQAHNLAMEMNVQTMVWAVLISALMGFALVFFYAAARPRFGAGPRTAAIVAIVFFFGSYAAGLVGYHMIRLYPDDLLLLWGLQGLVELILASIAGAWVYREDSITQAIPPR